MRIIKDFIKDEDKFEALRVLNKLKAGGRVFGGPAEGLKQTLKSLEDKAYNMEKNKSALDFSVDDSDIRQKIRLIKAGITGEERLAEFFEKIIKHDDVLQDCILFASLSDPDQSNNDDYISDSDFVAVYGNHILIIDAKNIRTNKEIPIYLDGNDLVSVGGKPIMTLNPSVGIWRRVFSKHNVTYFSISGCVVIVNDSGASVWRNANWHSSDVKPMHVSDLVEFMRDWVEDKDPETNLSLIVTLAKMQIKKEGTSLDLDRSLKRFGI